MRSRPHPLIGWLPVPRSVSSLSRGDHTATGSVRVTHRPYAAQLL